MYYHFKIHNGKDGMWAECLELKGCITQSEDGTIENLRKNMDQVLDLYLDEPRENVVFSLPDENLKGKNIEKVKVRPELAFAMYLKHERKKHNFSQNEMAKKLGFKSIWSYQRLETAKSKNPELKTLSKIKQLFPDFDMNYVF